MSTTAATPDPIQPIDPLAALRASADPEHDVYLTGTVFLDIIFTGLDHAPVRGTESWARGMGSSPGGIANMATALARLGLHTTLAAAFGTDVYGDYCWESLALGERVDLTHSRRVPGWHSPVTVSMAYEGERTMVTHEHPAPPPAVQGAPPRSRACVTAFEPGRQEDWVRQAHAQGSKIFADVGWDESGRWDPAALPDLPYTHAFLPNAAEAQRYTRTDSPERAVRALAELVPIAVVTRGAEGAVAIDSLTGESAEVPGLPVDALDPTGAGDVFVAGFMTGTLAGWPLTDRLAFANLTAALSVQHFGGSLAAPGWPEVAAWWNRVRRPADGAADAAELARRYAFLGELIPDRVRDCPRPRALPTIGFRVHDSAQRS
ncbi:PfkB family carbohydrate kinase [Streptomyces sp. NEAU-YJ-81]|uniref:carbohydrate kinase family protein n=1 Tax=Streptomyces sp. NEAU-YJ-81 TaxID=2820288 RepID=UPI001ABCF5DF|nr:PfkB family carbohydrate kinase [Streptomyces sp. NEAU-YJ-81]MBO3678007.1 carbohydrate kinase family protein [Streptomyces sp. NEAU-YJ-81]